MNALTLYVDAIAVAVEITDGGRDSAVCMAAAVELYEAGKPWGCAPCTGLLSPETERAIEALSH